MQLNHNEVLVSPSALGGKYTCDVIMKGHTLVADEPVEEGGMDLGPAPFEFLAAALATCTSMTLRMYAEHKGIELGKFHVKVNPVRSKDPTTGQVNLLLERELFFEDVLEEEKRVKYTEIANKCPVHRALSGKITIETEIYHEQLSRKSL